MIHGLVALSLLVAPTAAAAPAVTPEVTITNLYDAFGKPDPALTQDYGYSVLIRYRGKTILFDSGSNADTFRKNCAALHVDPKKIDFAIASHDHFDHVNGFDWLLTQNPKLKIYFPNDRWAGAPSTFDLSGRNPDIAKQLPPEMQYFGGKGSGSITLAPSGRFWRANVDWVDQSKEIAPGIRLIATTASLMGYFTKYPGTITDPSANPSYDEKLEGLPEISLALETSKGEVLVVGCSHSSIDAIVLATKEATKAPIDTVVGGLHLLPYDATFITGEARRLHDDYGVKRIAPGHCTGALGFKILRDLYQDEYLFLGLGSTISL